MKEPKDSILKLQSDRYVYNNDVLFVLIFKTLTNWNIDTLYSLSKGNKSKFITLCAQEIEKTHDVIQVFVDNAKKEWSVWSWEREQEVKDQVKYGYPFLAPKIRSSLNKAILNLWDGRGITKEESKPIVLSFYKSFLTQLDVEYDLYSNKMENFHEMINQFNNLTSHHRYFLGESLKVEENNWKGALYEKKNKIIQDIIKTILSFVKNSSPSFFEKSNWKDEVLNTYFKSLVEMLEKPKQKHCWFSFESLIRLKKYLPQNYRREIESLLFSFKEFADEQCSIRKESLWIGLYHELKTLYLTEQECVSLKFEYQFLFKKWFLLILDNLEKLMKEKHPNLSFDKAIVKWVEDESIIYKLF